MSRIWNLLWYRLIDYIGITEIGLNVHTFAAKNSFLSNVVNVEINWIDTNPLNISSENFNNIFCSDLRPEMYINQAHGVI